jgi:uncharacterized protein YkwD
LVVAAGFFATNLSLGVFDDLFFGNLVKKVGEMEAVLKEQATVDFSVQETEKEISSPSPLKIFQPASNSVSLGAGGVLQWTNVQRQAAGLPSLMRNSVLDQIAQRKVQDMFAHQYFEHVSPAGLDVGDLAEYAGYAFIAVGENLALGNYASDQALVQAWMDSSGHRENILGARYEEIGIAVQKGLYEGNSTWLAVQTFALPLAACDFPDENMKAQIDLEKTQIAQLGVILAQMRELDTKQVKEYNVLVDQYNMLVRDVQASIAQYNVQAQAFNSCAQ